MYGKYEENHILGHHFQIACQLMHSMTLFLHQNCSYQRDQLCSIRDEYIPFRSEVIAANTADI